MRLKTFFCLNLLLVPSLFSYAAPDYPQSVQVEPLPPLAEYKGVKIMDGGYGSSLAQKPGDKKHFYLLADRGPNYDTGVLGEKAFATPDYAPHIGVFEIEGKRLKLIKKIIIKDSDGSPTSGLPNPVGAGGTGEKPLDATGKRLKEDPRGLDPEGLVALADGTFWISDEYGPHLLHLDAEGKTIEKINPFTKGRSLPKALARRRPNRGMEGLTITPDHKYLVGIIQSSLLNPAESPLGLTRILLFEIATGKTNQYLYRFDKPPFMASEIAAISNTQFLVIEPDEFFSGGTPNAECKKVYKIDLSQATDVSDPQDRDKGLLFDGKTVEQLTASDLDKYKIKSVQKELVLDMLQTSPPYPHDKPEGIVILGKNLIAVSDDDDFGITKGPATGSIAQKRLSSGEIDILHIYFYHLPHPLY